jgi:hypothetical protein
VYFTVSPVQAEGLSGIPVTDLGSIITRIAATRLARGQASQLPQLQDQQQQLEAAAAADAPAQVESLPAIVQEAMPQAWKALALCAGKMVEMFRPIAFVENKDTDTQVRCLKTHQASHSHVSSCLRCAGYPRHPAARGGSSTFLRQ